MVDSGGDMKHMLFIEAVLHQDFACLVEKERTYKGSWKKRGGVGAAMMTLRKVDRLENILASSSYDVFQAVAASKGSEADGTALAEIRDLRRYLILVEAELMSRGVVAVGRASGAPAEPPASFLASGAHNSVKEDSNKHAFLRIQDGLSLVEYEEAGVPVIDARLPDGMLGGPIGIVDRNRCDYSVWSHLPRLPLEANATEHDNLPVEYAWMYFWDTVFGKYRLAPAYVDKWARES